MNRSPIAIDSFTLNDVARFWTFVDNSDADGCWLWTGATNGGRYGAFTMRHRSIGSHRFAFAVAHGPIPSDHFVCHHCDIPLCVRWDHLWLGTAQSNMADRDAKGRVARGARHGSYTHPERVPRGLRSGAYTHPEKIRRGSLHGGARLNEDKVRMIKRLLSSGLFTVPDIAFLFSVGKSTIGHIQDGDNWKHVT